jgi:hypothetical protein
MAYVNEIYPASNRLYSRPYACYLRHLLETEKAKEQSMFCEALYNIGKELIGGPAEYCCDLDKFIPESIHPPFWHERTVIELEIGREEYKRTLSAKGQRAVDNIISQVKDCNDFPRRGYASGLKRNNSYDVHALKQDFLTLWEEDIMMDARIAHAEELFAREADDATENIYYVMSNTGSTRLEATLDWMARPQNSENVALMFLYSRISQHFGEVNPGSFEFARRIARDIDSSKKKQVIDRLTYNPEGYYNGENLSIKGAFRKALHPVVHAFSQNSSLERECREENKSGLINAKDLADGARQIVNDYLSLRSGSWAETEKLVFLLKEMAKKSVSPSPAPG